MNTLYYNVGNMSKTLLKFSLLKPRAAFGIFCVIKQNFKRLRIYLINFSGKKVLKPWIRVDGIHPDRVSSNQGFTQARLRGNRFE